MLLTRIPKVDKNQLSKRPLQEISTGCWKSLDRDNIEVL